MAMTDVWITVLWTSYFFGAVLATRQLAQKLGITVISQSMIACIVGLVDISGIRAGLGSTLSAVFAIGIGWLVAICHIPLLWFARPRIFLLFSLVAHLLTIELWLAFPGLTGGSGGLFYPSQEIKAAGQVFGALALATGLVALHRTSSSVPLFAWECAKQHGPDAGVFGINTALLYLVAFSTYGVVLAGIGVSAHRTLGYVVVNAFPLSWALSVLMLSVLQSTIYTTFILSISYSAITIILRQSVVASGFVASLFEMAFPLIVASLVLVQKLSKTDRQLDA
jgi:hypothetical protein